LIYSDSAVSFTNIIQIKDADITIAGMVARQCCLPLLALNNLNAMSGVDQFYTNAQCLGDILKQYNYKLNFIKGANIKILGAHHPNGHLSHSCNNDLYLNGKNTMLNTFKCSDKLVTKLITKIQNSKYRTNLFVVFNTTNVIHKDINNRGSSLDIAPTILSFLKIDTNVGLGKNLFKEKSIFNSFISINRKIDSWRNDI
jgi:phosphoglycerol transferase MdoB-like AlkP superfamily enzyme